MILFNGARVWDPVERRYVFATDLARNEALAALDLARGVPASHVNLYLGDEILISHRSELSVESEVKDGVPHTVVGDLAEWLEQQARDPIKLMLISEPERLEGFREEFLVRSDGSTNLIRSEHTYLELTRKGVNKGAALAAALKHYGIAREEVVSFGDNLNDIELLRSSGLGVAMENSHPGLKEVAGRVIGHHSTDAISRFIEENVLV
jgi:Cof subfamily protein (haloacid dehalogenase superfamily)